MKSNPLLKLGAFGQSIWLNFLRRGLYTSGELQRMIQEDGLRGMTSNPAIFDKAIAGSHDYDDAIRALALEGKSARQTYETLTVEDVQHAADINVMIKVPATVQGLPAIQQLIAWHWKPRRIER